VDAYRTSETMRATFVGRRKVDDTLRGGVSEPADDSNVPLSTSQDSENLRERNLRQAAERERLMRQMELEEAGGDAPSSKASKPTSRWDRSEKKPSLFPPDFPDTPEDEGMSPFELLEKYEKMIFDKIKQ